MSYTHFAEGYSTSVDDCESEVTRLLVVCVPERLVITVPKSIVFAWLALVVNESITEPFIWMLMVASFAVPASGTADQVPADTFKIFPLSEDETLGSNPGCEWFKSTFMTSPVENVKSITPSICVVIDTTPSAATVMLPSPRMD